jgi:hypothetical protein
MYLWNGMAPDGDKLGQRWLVWYEMFTGDILSSNVTLEYVLFVQRISGRQAFPATMKRKAKLIATQVRLVNRVIPI